MAEKVENYHFSKRFRKQYRALPKEIQNAFDKKLNLFLNNRSHPSLRVKRIQGTENRWEGSVTMNYRFTFEFSEKTVFFRAIGTHDILNR
jgi:mRNA-degrading endonuclease RelE of RelBE toxin-antitoxin system